MTKVLLVDDSAEIRDRIKGYFNDDSWDFHVAVDGLEGLGLFKKHGDFELVLSDLEMPKMMGHEMVRKIRELDDIDQPVIIIMSTFHDRNLIKQSQDLNIFTWILKPVSPDLPKIIRQSCKNLQNNESRKKSIKEIIETIGIETLSNGKHYKQTLLDWYEESTKKKDVLLSEIIEREKVQNTLEETKDLVGVQQEKMNEQQQRLVEEKQVRNIAGIISGIAHELNTPVGTIRTVLSSLDHNFKEFQDHTAQGLKKSHLNTFLEQFQDATNLMNKNLDRTLGLLRNFKNLKLDYATAPTEEMSLTDSIDAFIKRSKGRYDASCVKFKVSHDTQITSCHDPKDIDAILEELIENSVVHNPNRNLTIEVSAKLDDEQIILNVSDNGEGVSDQIKSQIFDPFFTTKRKEGHIGLGLQVIRILVSQKLGGTLDCKSTQEKTTFTVTFPQKLQKTLDNNGSRQALVVDDSVYFREIISNILGQCNIEVTLAQSTFEAIKLCRERSFDLLTLDYSMPCHTGVELLDELTNNNLIPNTKVIFISGEPLEVFNDRINHEGVFHLMKPINSNSLKQLVRQMAHKKV